MTNNSHDATYYYGPRKANMVPKPPAPPIVPAHASWVERYGELIAMSLALFVMGAAAGMVVFAMIFLP